MSQRKHCVIFVLFSIFSYVHSYASIPLTYHQYQTSDGICNNFITSLIEDHKGFIWATTNYGISR